MYVYVYMHVCVYMYVLVLKLCMFEFECEIALRNVVTNVNKDGKIAKRVNTIIFS